VTINQRADAAKPERLAANAPTLNEGTPITDQTGIEAPTSVERDARGLGYIGNLIALYLLFGIALFVIAWFGIFSEA
jgi:hypothetical protein